MTLCAKAQICIQSDNGGGVVAAAGAIAILQLGYDGSALNVLPAGNCLSAPFGVCFQPLNGLCGRMRG